MKYTTSTIIVLFFLLGTQASPMSRGTSPSQTINGTMTTEVPHFVKPPIALTTVASIAGVSLDPRDASASPATTAVPYVVKPPIALTTVATEAGVSLDARAPSAIREGTNAGHHRRMASASARDEPILYSAYSNAQSPSVAAAQTTPAGTSPTVVPEPTLSPDYNTDDESSRSGSNTEEGVQADTIAARQASSAAANKPRSRVSVVTAVGVNARSSAFAYAL